MKKLKVILTGATGMVGEGVLLECLYNEQVAEVLLLSRKHYPMEHPKLKEVLLPDFFAIEEKIEQLSGYDACFYCAGVSVIRKSETEYTHITYDTTICVAATLLKANPGMVFHYVSGRSTDSTEKGKAMWARVKGRTENDLMSMGFKAQYNFRPGFMSHFKEQKNVKAVFKIFGLFYPRLFPKDSLTLSEVGRAMIHAAQKGTEQKVLEISAIKAWAI